MVKETLVEKDISDGKKLILRLDNSEFKVTSAFWLYTSESEAWFLYLASNYVDDHNKKRAYEFIQKELLKFDPAIGIPLSSINPVKVNNTYVKLLKTVVFTEPDTLNEIRLTDVVINGVMIEDALIYRTS